MGEPAQDYVVLRRVHFPHLPLRAVAPLLRGGGLADDCRAVQHVPLRLGHSAYAGLGHGQCARTSEASCLCCLRLLDRRPGLHAGPSLIGVATDWWGIAVGWRWGFYPALFSPWILLAALGVDQEQQHDDTDGLDEYNGAYSVQDVET